MSQKNLKEIIEEQFEADSMGLPVFNRVALELQQIQSNPTASMGQIAQVLMKDQSLSARVLQVANSSFFGGLKKVDTISQAVIRLGMGQVSSLAMAASQALAHQSREPVISAYMSGLWARSFACSIGGRYIAMKIGAGERAEEAFLAGLLHDIGELFLLKVLEKLTQDGNNPLPLSVALLEDILSAMHNEVGYRLMIKWELPESYAVIARDHHRETLENPEPILLITRLMDLTCQKLGLGCKAVPDIMLAATPEALQLGIGEIKLAELEVMLEDQKGEISSILNA